jgi:hypothetical protein
MNKKISQLNAVTDTTWGDLLAYVNNSETKKITLAQLMKALGCKETDFTGPYQADHSYTLGQTCTISGEINLFVRWTEDHISDHDGVWTNDRPYFTVISVFFNVSIYDVEIISGITPCIDGVYTFDKTTNQSISITTSYGIVTDITIV